MDHAASAATPIDEWFEIIKKNATKNPTKEDYDQFVKFTKDHEKDFAAQDDKSNPLFWQDAEGNNALHLLLATHEIDGEKGSPLFWLLMRNAQFEGKKDALLQTNNKLDSAFKIGIKNYKIRKKSGLFGKEVRGDVYLTSNDGDFLTKSSTKVDDNGNTLLHIMALASGVESFLKLQKIMIANLKAKDSDFELKFLMGQRNAAKRTPLEVALLSKNFYLANKLLKRALEHKEGFEDFDIDKKSDTNPPQRLLDLMFVRDADDQSRFKDFNIKNFVICKFEERGSKLTQNDWDYLGKLPRHYGENLRLFKKFLQRLIDNGKDLRRNRDLTINPINECLKMGLFDEALALIKKSDEEMLRSADGEGRIVMQAITQTKDELRQFIYQMESVKGKDFTYFDKIFTDLKNAVGEVLNKEFIDFAKDENDKNLNKIASDKRLKKYEKSPEAVFARAATAAAAAPASNRYATVARIPDDNIAEDDSDSELTAPRNADQIIAQAAAASAETSSNLYQTLHLTREPQAQPLNQSTHALGGGRGDNASPQRTIDFSLPRTESDA